MELMRTLTRRAVCYTAALLLNAVFAAADDRFPGNGPAIEADPLAWLKADMSCSELTDQIKARYAPLGKFSDMPEGKKAELREVLAAVCSSKFARCGFRSCGDGKPRESSAPAATAADPGVLSEVELTERAEARLRAIVADLERSRGIAISAAKKTESQQKLAWQRIIMPEEAARETTEEKPAREPDSVPAPAPKAAGKRPPRDRDAAKPAGKKSSPPTSFSY